MTNEEKQLLLKDLCSRLPYGVKIYHRGSVEEIREIAPTGEFKNYNYNAWFSIYTCTIKPYLRPMSSMTEEEFKEYHSMLIDVDNSGLMNQGLITKIVDWLDRKMFDHRNLVPKGLAIEAPEGMYKTE